MTDGPWASEDWRRPSRRLRVMRWTEVGAATLAGVVIAAVIAGAAGSFVALGAGLGVVALLAAALGVFLDRRVRAWAYLERKDDLLVRRGVLVRRLSVVPYGRMQFVDVTAGPVERAFKLATVRMHTAAAASDARIPGLDRPEADRLRDQLAALGEAQQSGL